VFFYFWGAPKFIIVILLTTLCDFILVERIHKANKKRIKQLFLGLSLSINLGLLCYFKYSNFFIENINLLIESFGYKIEWFKLALPIGISFYTFESLTYTIDVYRGVHKPLKNFKDYLLYIILFPKLIAGPIIRYHEISDQISDREKNETIDNKINGIFRFLIGLSKKVIIANVLGKYADNMFAISIDELTTDQAWIGAILYTFQIYFDFSGYSDMAIGLGLLFGFKFPENFNNPYLSQSITEFWRRWHMTLGNWMKNYLYIPLGGNKVKTKNRLYFNLWLVFLASGLWHGAAWTFIVWGAYHGLFLILERAFLLKIYSKIGKPISITITFLFVIVGWVIFRADSLKQASAFLSKMFSFDFSVNIVYLLPEKTVTTLIFAMIGTFGWALFKTEKVQSRILHSDLKWHTAALKGIIGFVMMYICLSSIISSDFNPFIYFRF
jgi:alginate O-acetyltransferase complex protein AlgI